MVKTERPTKRERQRAAAESRAAARRRREQRKWLALALGGLAIVALVALGVVGFVGNGGDQGVGPSTQGATSAGPERGQPLSPGEPVPDFSAPGIGGGTVSWSD